MKTDLTQSRSPEETELIEKRTELDRLAALLAERELALEDIRISVARFQHRYFNQVGRKYVRLDDLRTQLAELQSKRAPADSRLRQAAIDARKQAGQSADEYRDAELQDKTEVTEENAPDEVKKLYRKIAFLVHPDKATDEKTRGLRTRLMAELNDAYARRDMARMRSILAEWEHSPDSVEGEGTAIDLVRTIRGIAQVKRRIAAIDAEIAEIESTDIHALMVKAHEADLNGCDILSDMAMHLDQQIADLLTQIKTARG